MITMTAKEELQKFLSGSFRSAMSTDEKAERIQELTERIAQEAAASTSKVAPIAKSVEFVSAFPGRLNYLLHRAGLTHLALSKRLFVSKSLIGKWKSGRSIPTAENYLQMVQVLGEVTEDGLYNIGGEYALPLNKAAELLALSNGFLMGTLVEVAMLTAEHLYEFLTLEAMEPVPVTDSPSEDEPDFDPDEDEEDDEFDVDEDEVAA